MSRGVRRLFAAALAGLAAAPAVSAQATPAEAAPLQLEPLVVTATRQPLPRLEVPAAISVLDAGDLRGARAALSLSESLPRIPGVVVRERQNQAQDVQLSIRGFGARASFGVRGVRLYADGIPATMPDGQGQVSHFLLPAAERIEVLRGPFSVLYGNSSGGVVSVFSEAPPARAEAGAEGRAGSDGLWRASASWRGPVAGNAGLRLDLQRAAADGYRRHSAWRRDGAQLQLRGQTSRGGEWTVLGNHLDLAADDPQGLTAAQLAGDRRASSQGALLFDTLAARGLTRRMPVIFLTGHGDISTAVEAVKNGAFDFYEKPTTDQRLVERVKQALQKSGEFLANLEVLKQWSERIDRLSPREREVMFLVAKGKLNKVIASELDISMRTVEVHRANVFEKLKVRSAAELATLLSRLSDRLGFDQLAGLE